MSNTPTYTKLPSKVIRGLEQAIEDLQESMNELQRELVYQKSLIENNTYEGDLNSVLWAIEEQLENEASEACEGSRNCGLEEYTQRFICNDIPYEAKMTFEYNRHDKTYYYIEESHFSYKQIE